ncbi:hypothetical protein OZ411_01325 [Bradyrhizobium sp. Arg237L]|uniref:phage tail assembly chaperone n=1 Tax=Bradyrhizobium sp. Arg237L TaxID=3003352 RepID=UPI00249E3B8B|nr:hypothetical protein [Bradyrhizobium sp. Arg237L]MDI4231454.1 hypothetical protein [Bradyrhizobium sp. Arg237L]
MQGLIKRTRNEAKRAGYEEQLRCPPLPRSLDYLWRTYHRLRRRKGSNGFAMSPIEWPDFDAFVRHAGLRLAPWEVEAIEELDDLFLRSLTADKGDGSGEQQDE